MHVRRKYHLPSHADRLRAQGLLTTTELAQRLTVHPSTIKSWTKAGILNSHKANDKNERLYEPPITGDPRLTVRQGSPLRNEFTPNPPQEVHYEAKPLSVGVRGRARWIETSKVMCPQGGGVPSGTSWSRFGTL